MVVRVLASEAYDHEISHVKPATLRNTCDMCALKEFWKEAPQAIEELKEGEVLVTRIVKDGQLRVVFWNEIKPGDETAGKHVEKEFFDLWHSLKVPNDVDLLKALHTEGLQATAEGIPIPKAPSNVKKGNARHRDRDKRRSRIHI